MAVQQYEAHCALGSDYAVAAVSEAGAAVHSFLLFVEELHFRQSFHHQKCHRDRHHLPHGDVFGLVHGPPG